MSNCVDSCQEEGMSRHNHNQIQAMNLSWLFLQARKHHNNWQYWTKLENKHPSHEPQWQSPCVNKSHGRSSPVPQERRRTVPASGHGLRPQQSLLDQGIGHLECKTSIQIPCVPQWICWHRLNGSEIGRPYRRPRSSMALSKLEQLPSREKNALSVKFHNRIAGVATNTILTKTYGTKAENKI